MRWSCQDNCCNGDISCCQFNDANTSRYLHNDKNLLWILKCCARDCNEMFLNDRDGWVGISTVGSFVVVETNIIIVTINSPGMYAVVVAKVIPVVIPVAQPTIRRLMMGGHANDDESIGVSSGGMTSNKRQIVLCYLSSC